ncbi:hypothetical protein, partial [Lentzea sp. NPDC004782]|uniref:hypothetical protein n=1 Tax=Lentzea sp. NPDC004782 TaxID=3154458 RepID=UPI0033A16D2A
APPPPAPHDGFDCADRSTVTGRISLRRNGFHHTATITGSPASARGLANRWVFLGAVEQGLDGGAAGA